MDWQTYTTLVILMIACGVLLRRLSAFFRASRAGTCGSCGSCGDSAKDKVELPVVPLGTGSAAANRRGSQDAVAEKTG